MEVNGLSEEVRRQQALARAIPSIKVEGLEDQFVKDIRMHRGNRDRAKNDLVVHKAGLAHVIAEKRHYRDLIKKKKAGDPKWDLDSLEAHKKRLDVSVRQYEDAIKLSKDRIEHFSAVVKGMEKKAFAEYGLEV